MCVYRRKNEGKQKIENKKNRRSIRYFFSGWDTGWHRYADLTVTAQYSLTLIDSLFDGEFASFYKNAMNSGIAPEGAVYDIGIYLVFAVWGFPVWILKKIFGISVLAAGGLLWFKVLLVLFAVGNAIVTEKIAKELKIVTDGMRFFLFLSLLFNFPIFVAAQYDVIQKGFSYIFPLRLQ